MKATLEFDLDTERVEFKMASDYLENYCMLWELVHNFHREFNDIDDGKVEGVDLVLKRLREYLEDFKDYG